MRDDRGSSAKRGNREEQCLESPGRVPLRSQTFFQTVKWVQRIF